MSRPRVVRPKRDSAWLPLTLGGTALCGVAGYFLGVTVFRPSAQAEPTDHGPGVEVSPSTAAVTTPGRDGGALAPRTTVPVLTPLATARVGNGVLIGCGNGEEMNIPGAQCDNPAGMESALRDRLTAVVGGCPAAAQAARDSSRMLSLGLRVDHPRRRIAVLLGRSSTVSEKISYVSCVRDALGPMDALWRITPGHPRYLYYFAAHFAPLAAVPDAGAVAVAPPAPVAPEPATPATPEPATPAPPEPATPEPATPAPTPAPTPAVTPEPAVDGGRPAAIPGLPTAEELERMPALGTATVTYSAAIVRDAPRTGAVVGRVPQGTSVEVIDRRGSWHAIRWGNHHVGWTFHEAIGE